SVNLFAQGRIGSSENALEVEVGPEGGVGFVTGATEVFINTIPSGRSVTNILNTSEVLAAFQDQGFFQDALSQVAVASTVGLETTGLETTGLGELIYVDEGVFLLPDPYTTSVQATLLPVFMDPALPADLRPDNPADEQAWQSFYSGVLRDYVQSRYQLSENATQAERDAVEARIESEWRSLVEYFEGIRARELAAATGGTSEGG
ncbi:MAG: hypothetical protein GWN21_11720, partial [Gammaproteobacteria bacterium]|nr:hypothetical protein [Gammaproteobacteria bacterium]NIP89092.1 hypothetical protein [Gammaproteobacteria bacterium]NIR23952.1 hypothetical protein [Gammaproteobacteria bacterium]NIS05586.1 hypothetical protein [Gammaproteobacteria bacterium]NIU40900.1 hypothetical protein [Gammaproteobacteria bacterium]